MVFVLASLTDETLHGSLASTSFQIRVINDCDMTWQISCASNVVMKNAIFYTLVVREIRKKKLELKYSTSELDLSTKILHVNHAFEDL